MDLVVEDNSRVGTIYFLMSRTMSGARSPCPGSASARTRAHATEACSSPDPHPRAYGNFARLLGRYVRDERLIPLEEAVRRLTTLPAANLGIRDRGALREGHFADLAIFDPATIADRATFAEPHQYSVGMRHVFVNGVQVLADGEHAGATPGRVVRGPGWRRCSN